MSYTVQIQGGYPDGSGSATEKHHVKEAIANLYAALQDRGHTMTTAFLDGEPLNYQDGGTRNQALQEAQDHYNVMAPQGPAGQAEPHEPLSSEGKAPPTLETPQQPQTPGQAAGTEPGPAPAPAPKK